jgi:hypothetical protein
MSEQPIRKGDKVKLTAKPRVIVGELEELTSDGFLRLDGDVGHIRDPRNWDVEILERADDPGRDPVGTVAEFDDLVWVKTGERVWTVVGDPDHFRVDTAITGRTVTGAVPGTPAADAQGEPKATTGVAATWCSVTKRLGNGQLIRCSNASWHEATTEHYARHAGQDVFW